MPSFWNDITREEMSRLTGNYAPIKTSSTVRTSIRSTYANGSARCSLAEMNGKSQQQRYASTISLRSLAASEASLGCTNGLRNSLDYSSASLINLQDQVELERVSVSRRRSPSLPPIYNKEEYRYQEPEELPLGSRQSRSTHRCSRNGKTHRSGTRDKQHHHHHHRQGKGAEQEREGETSGYASDNFDGPAQQQQVVALPCHVNCHNPDTAMGERTWQNPYYSDENSLPSSRKLVSLARAGEFNRQRWGSVWGQEVSKDPPPPSWLERGLSRLDHSSQVLVINHDSASSPDSSTTGSLGSDTNKTYLRGQNQPIDADILQEREVRRQKALELQTAIKQQLEERERKRKEEREKKLREERAEEERIQRERDLEKQRFEEEQRRQREKEAAKLKKSKAMQEVLEAAERQAKEEKRQRRRRDDDAGNEANRPRDDKNGAENAGNSAQPIDKEAKQALNRRESSATMDTHTTSRNHGSSEPVRLPISQEVAIVLSGRLEDPELLAKSPLKLVNLVVSPRNGSSASRNIESGGGISLSALLSGLGSPVILQTTTRPSPRFAENRLLTPSKYRVASGRECGTQTDCEGDQLSSDLAEKAHEMRTKDAKERKEAANNSRRDVEKSTNTGDDSSTSKPLPGRNKSQPRITASLESRPRWNANRPGTRYRTQSEKDPHYQRRMRLRRRQVETSDEGSSDFQRSPSPSRRKHGITKAKSRSSARRSKTTKLDNYDPDDRDADLSMDSLNSLVPLHTDKNGRINIERRDEATIRGQNTSRDVWGGDDILSHLTSLRNGLIMKKREWDLQECPISPITELY
ncbi:MAP7 domain-containing protein 2 isoform X3 [Nasonia vitripennis]|uniref:CCDC66 domain-containing protein n=1 Tax=Nasonia vitripennis TaxID=7425 RepID=A0A7M7INX0_NASVI|nr:MAP7 domain-containing protein 2 isoform X3 [Nasonia vitripennis]